jgi:hypothetical protein
VNWDGSKAKRVLKNGEEEKKMRHGVFFRKE